jgi:hypothetical protein
MGKSTETESETEYEDEMEGSEIEGSEMDMEEHEWSQSTIDGSEENVMVADAERQWQVDTAIKIREMMSVFYRRCVLCWVNDVSAKHELSDCKEMPGKCIRCQSRDHSVRDCVQVRYTGGNCCWKCGLPQKLGRIHIHGEMSIGACEIGYMDKMFPLCWYLWRKTSWKGRLEAHFRQEWSEDGFREWICKIDRGLSNGVKVMLWLWNEIEMK